MDEFLRIRLLMDETEREGGMVALEKRLISRGAIGEARSPEADDASEDVFTRGNLLSIEGNELDVIDPTDED